MSDEREAGLAGSIKRGEDLLSTVRPCPSCARKDAALRELVLYAYGSEAAKAGMDSNVLFEQARAALDESCLNSDDSAGFSTLSPASVGANGVAPSRGDSGRLTAAAPGAGEDLERLAAIQHDIWSHWMRWFFENDTPENRERWKRQMATPYAELSERERESDRKVVREFCLPAPPAAPEPERFKCSRCRCQPGCCCCSPGRCSCQDDPADPDILESDPAPEPEPER